MEKKLTFEEAQALLLSMYNEGGEGFYECTESYEYEPMTKSELIDSFHRYESYRSEIWAEIF